MAVSVDALPAATPQTFDIQRFFPKNAYQQRCRADSKLALIYQVANRGKQTTILQLIDRFGCNYREPKWGLTAIHVAVMVGSHRVLESLISNKASVDVVDKQGFSPMLYACALNDTNSMQLLQEAQHVDVVLDVYHHFPEWKSILEPEYPNPTDVVCDSINGGPLTAQRFQDQSGAIFHPGCVASHDQWLNHLADRLEKGVPVDMRSPMNTLLKVELEKNLPLPKLLVGKQGAAGMGVFAGEKISRGRIITSYGGEYGGSLSNYVFAEIDGNRKRNLGPMVNDGFPNAGLYAVRYPDGRTVGLVLAFDEIEEGAPILVDYVDHQAKAATHEEIALDELEEFFRAHRFIDLYHLEDCFDSIESHCKVAFLKGRARYLCRTPSALSILYLKGVITDDALRMILASPDCEMCSQVEKLILNLKGLAEKTSMPIESVKEKLAEWLQRYALQALLFGMESAWFSEKLNRRDFHALEETLAALSKSLEKVTSVMPIIQDLGRVHKQLPAEVGARFGEFVSVTFGLTLSTGVLPWELENDLVG